MEVDKKLLYTNTVYRLNTAKSLLAFADEALKGGVYFKNLDKYKTAINYKNFHPIDFKTFCFNYLFENLRITTFFENFLKAFLLLNGKVVHKIDTSKEKSLSKKQIKQPIDISEIPDIEVLSENTIGISNLQKKAYCDIVQINLDFMKKLNPIFKYRNNVHFYIGETISDEKKFIEIYEEILKMSENNIDPTIKNIENIISNLINPKKT